MTMFNKKQKEKLAAFSFKVAEILMAGVVVAGFMQDKLVTILGKIIFGCAMIPLFMILGLVLDSGDDPP
jgi:hypothetical protein